VKQTFLLALPWNPWFFILMELLTAKIIERVPGLPPQLAAGARFLLDHPDLVVVRSMRDIAARTGVSPATLVRLARNLGFADWTDLREAFVGAFRASPGIYSRGASALIHGDGAASLLPLGSRDLADNVARLMTANSTETFEAAVDRLARAPRIMVAAFLSCRAPGMTFTYVSRMFREHVYPLGYGDTSVVADLVNLTAEDVVLSINFQPYARQSLLVADAVQLAGAGLILLADSHVTPLTQAAERVLYFQTAGPSYFPSILAATALVELLAAGMMRHMGDGAARHLARVEDGLFASDAYVTGFAAGQRKPVEIRELP